MAPLDTSLTRLHVSPLHSREPVRMQASPLQSREPTRQQMSPLQSREFTRQTMSPINRRIPLNVSPVSHTLSNISHVSKAPPAPTKTIESEDYKSLYYKALHDKSVLELALQKKQLALQELQQKLSFESGTLASYQNQLQQYKASENTVQQQSEEMMRLQQKVKEQEEMIQNQREVMLDQ